MTTKTKLITAGPEDVNPATRFDPRSTLLTHIPVDMVQQWAEDQAFIIGALLHQLSRRKANISVREINKFRKHHNVKYEASEIGFAYTIVGKPKAKPVETEQ